MIYPAVIWLLPFFTAVTEREMPLLFYQNSPFGTNAVVYFIKKIAFTNIILRKICTTKTRFIHFITSTISVLEI